MQNDEKIANYIGSAVIMLTAAHLGIEVSMLNVAKEVWHTKHLPDTPLLGYFAQAADKARKAVLSKGLGEKADRLGQVFYMTGEFPEPCLIKQYQDYLTVHVLRSTLGDCTNGGVSNRSDSFDLFASHLSYAQVADYCIEKSIDVNKVLKLVYREHLNYLHAEPIIDRNKRYMAGGNFIYTSDSRFKELTNVRYPVSIHDRTE